MKSKRNTYNTSQQADIVITWEHLQENEIPICIPPPGICQIHVTPSSHNSPLVQVLVHSTLHHIRTTSSAMPNGAFFEEDIADVKEVLSLTSQLRHPNCGPEAQDPITANLMERLRLICGHDSEQVVFCNPLFTLLQHTTPHHQNTIPVPAVPISEGSTNAPAPCYVSFCLYVFGFRLAFTRRPISCHGISIT